jgi:hypothetical protein
MNVQLLVTLIRAVIMLSQSESGLMVRDVLGRTWQMEAWRRYKILKRKFVRKITSEQHLIILAYIEELRKIYDLPRSLDEVDVASFEHEQTIRFARFSYLEMDKFENRCRERRSDLTVRLDQVGLMVLPLPNELGEDATVENIVDFVAKTRPLEKHEQVALGKYIGLHNDLMKEETAFATLTQLLIDYDPPEPTETPSVTNLFIIGEKADTPVEQNADVPNSEGLRKFRRGELQQALKAILRDKDFAERHHLILGRTVPSKTVLFITNILRARGWDAQKESVETKLRTMGYYTEMRKKSDES